MADRQRYLFDKWVFPGEQDLIDVAWICAECHQVLHARLWSRSSD